MVFVDHRLLLTAIDTGMFRPYVGWCLVTFLVLLALITVPLRFTAMPSIGRNIHIRIHIQQPPFVNNSKISFADVVKVLVLTHYGEASATTTDLFMGSFHYNITS